MIQEVLPTVSNVQRLIAEHDRQSTSHPQAVWQLIGAEVPDHVHAETNAVREGVAVVGVLDLHQCRAEEQFPGLAGIAHHPKQTPVSDEHR
jgi:hypothetical protein